MVGPQVLQILESKKGIFTNLPSSCSFSSIIKGWKPPKERIASAGQPVFERQRLNAAHHHTENKTKT